MRSLTICGIRGIIDSNPTYTVIDSNNIVREDGPYHILAFPYGKVKYWSMKSGSDFIRTDGGPSVISTASQSGPRRLFSHTSVDNYYKVTTTTEKFIEWCTERDIDYLDASEEEYFIFMSEV